MDRNKTVRISGLAAFGGLTETEFTVYKLWSAPNPLNNRRQERKLLQIF